MSLKAVIFDFGGVLVRTQGRDLRRQWEQRLGLKPDQLEHIVFGGETGWAVQLGTMSDAAHWERLGQRFNLEPAALAQLQRDFFATDALDTQLLAYIARLRGAGLHLGLLSNASDIAREIFTVHYPLISYFDSVTISAEEHVMKPDPRIFQLALARAGAAPTEAVFVDDAIANVEAARALGMTAVHFRDPDAAQRELVALTGVA